MIKQVSRQINDKIAVQNMFYDHNQAHNHKVLPKFRLRLFFNPYGGWNIVLRVESLILLSALTKL